MKTLAIPLFPLYTVLFPQGVIPLRIFEPRYLEMVSSCLKTESGFGICLIREGSEIGKAADIYDTGTLSEISYFERHPDGLLGITACGKQRFHILSKEVLSNQLIMATVELIPNEPSTPVPEDYLPAVKLLRHLMDQLAYRFLKKHPNYNDAYWVSCRLAELLPLRLEQKQHLLQINDAQQRLQILSGLIEELDLSLTSPNSIL